MGKRKIILSIAFVLLLIGSINALVIYINSRNFPSKSPDKASVVMQEPRGYPNAILVNSSEPSGKAISKIWETSDSQDLVSAFYKNELGKGGWQITSVNEKEEFTSYSFEKAGASGFVGIGKGGLAKTMITLTLGVK